MKLNQFLFDAATGKNLSESEISEAYTAMRDLQNIFKSLPKKTFTLTKGDKERKISATCTAEIKANPANKGWEVSE